MGNDDRRDEGGRLRNPGGTRGGAGEFLFGLAMVIAGGYLFVNNLVVTSGGGFFGRFGFSGGAPFGVSVLPLLVGIGFLFFNGRSWVGWLLTLGASLAIFVGIITSLTVHWRPASLYFTIAILVLLGGGLGLIARGLKEH